MSPLDEQLLHAAGRGDLPAVTLSRKGVCPAGLLALLGQQWQHELAAMLRATNMLVTMDPAARAGVLAELLDERTQLEDTHAIP